MRASFGIGGCVCLLGVALVTPVASGAVVFNNFGPLNAFGNSGRLVQGPDVNTIGDVDQAVKFTVGAGKPFDLTSASLGIYAVSSPAIGTGPVAVQLAADSAGLPGAVLASTTVNVNATGKQMITANFPGLQQLNANTSYWVIMNGQTTFDGAWYYNSTGDTGPTAGRSDGFPWNLHADNTRMALRVEGNVVPEPAMAGLVCTAIALVGRRRRSH
jgi:hypothetical protein